MGELKKIIEHLRGLIEIAKRDRPLMMVVYFLEMALVEAEEEMVRRFHQDSPTDDADGD
ncbi:hypothetical protein [Neorhizobium galegae]|uniref:Uncharacterized protein n=1 Tax=Neorhizobium galegae bv. orientalis str. HAMBI 540 TaxID=1028800 RepID=A0A068SZI7_NEOGA|nr:hypothetical protein [Neorhizobium galegae]MCQ1854464.1 hypothetical protein [Neorhizobium galegae]CDN51578.1 Hypothetical protein RG540_PA09020 [Neorhizobium galegae bv. orientalis str. HAMBI 540]CDZ54666.1 Hypothetical protein NGAL_HAMBI2427_57480 [Neorhizobium galegae bv. orientalis]